MERRTAVALAAAALVLLLAAGTWLVHTERLASESRTSTYSYTVAVETDAPLTDVTVLAPLPVRDGSSPVVEAIREGDPNVSVPAGWSAEVTSSGYGPMLRLTADELEPRYRNASPTPIEDGVAVEDGNGADDAPEPTQGTGAPVSDEFHVQIEVPGRIDTMNATETEPLLAPTLNATEADCDWPHPEDWEGRLRCMEYDTRFRLTYDVDASAGNAAPRVGLRVEHGGENSWWVYGWTGNEYRQRARLDAVGRTGWLRADGQLVVGDGTYR